MCLQRIAQSRRLVLAWVEIFYKSPPAMQMCDFEQTYLGRRITIHMKKIDANNQNTSNHIMKYSFDNFVVGNGNKLAYEICKEVVRAPFQCKYNPIFIYGELGNGKTHLLRAVANSISSQNSNVNVLYKSSEAFVIELIDAIRKDYDAVAEFRNRYSKADILLIDDIQFIEGKENTQQEFGNIFQTLCDDNKQIILSSARPPKAMKNLTDGLVSRLAGGVIVHIDKPDYETRMNVLKQLAKREQSKEIPEELLSYIAENITNDIRLLEGAFWAICVHSKILNQPIDKEMINTFLQDRFTNKED